MSEITIQLSDAHLEFIEAKVAAGEISSVDAYIGALIQQARKRQAWDRLEELTAEGLASPIKEMTQEDWDDIRRAAAQAAQNELTHGNDRSK